MSGESLSSSTVNWCNVFHQDKLTSGMEMALVDIWAELAAYAGEPVRQLCELRVSTSPSNNAT
eukprot:1223671-Amphidinium_carterae.1